MTSWLRGIEYNGMGYCIKDGKPHQYFYCYNAKTHEIDFSKPFIYEPIFQREPTELGLSHLFKNKQINNMEKYEKPKVGDKLFFPKYGLLTVHERGILKRGDSGIIGITRDSEYSIMEDANGNVIMKEGKAAWFYDDLLEKSNFEINKMTPKKLIRGNIISKLKEGEWETITDQDELNKLYAIKVREELAEIQESNHKDIMEFVDLIQVAMNFAMENGFSVEEISNAIEKKGTDKGVFSRLALNNLNPSNPSNKIYFEKTV